MDQFVREEQLISRAIRWEKVKIQHDLNIILEFAQIMGEGNNEVLEAIVRINNWLES